MQNDDMALLREYARNGSEAAFATLVARHVNLVYSVALHQVRNAHLAEEITQVVFVILARKSGSLGPQTILPGWLCRTARYTSSRAFTAQCRRQRREQEAHMQTLENPTETEAWTQIAPLLDAALAQLSNKDHDAIVLRFFEGKDMQAVGERLGTNEVSARKRVSRAVEKLRNFFVRRGVVLSAAVLAGTIGANAIQAAPAGLAASVTAVAAAQGAGAGAAALALVKSTLKLMWWAKLKSGAATAGVAVLLAGAVTMAVEASAGTPAPAAPAPALTFESCIQHPPRILNAVFEVEAPGSTNEFEIAGPSGEITTNRNFQPPETNVYRLKYDGQNYSLVHVAGVDAVVGLGGSGGQFGDVQWGAHRAPNPARTWLTVWNTNSDPVEFPKLDLSDLVLFQGGTNQVTRMVGKSVVVTNQIQTNHVTPFAMANLEIMASYEAHELICLGMGEMVPGTAVWTNGQPQFTATYDEPGAFRPVVERDAAGAPIRTNFPPLHGQMTVKLTYDHGVPIQADTLLDQPAGALDTGNLFTLTYKYSPDFAGGRFPVEFDNYYYPAPGRREKSFTIRVHELELAPGPIPIADFDYHQAMNRRQMQVDVWTNGMRYRETPNGLVKPPSLEELATGDTRRFQREAFGRAPGAPGRRNQAGPGEPRPGLFARISLLPMRSYLVGIELVVLGLAVFLLVWRRRGR